MRISEDIQMLGQNSAEETGEQPEPTGKQSVERKRETSLHIETWMRLKPSAILLDSQMLRPKRQRVRRLSLKWPTTIMQVGDYSKEETDTVLIESPVSKAPHI